MAEEVATDVKSDPLGDALQGDDQTSTPDPSADDNKDDQAIDKPAGDEPAADPDTEGDDDADDADDDTDDTKDDQSKKAHNDPEARKEVLKSEIRELVAQRGALRAEIANTNSTVYRPQTAEELEEQGLDPAMAAVKALEQKSQMAEFNNHVSDLNANLNVESLQVMTDYPIFDPESPKYDEAFSDQVTAVYQKVAGVMRDPKTGLIVRANVLPYEIYKAFAQTYAAGAKTGEVDGQKATDKMLANAETPSSAAPKKSAKDPFAVGLMGGKV